MLRQSSFRALVQLCFVLCFGSVPASAQAASAIPTVNPARITSKVDDARRVTLPGFVHPLASAANDRGRVADSMPLNRVQVQLKRSDAQNAAATQLLEDLHNPASASFHKWLTPEEFGKRFSASDEDVATITAWLAGKGLTVTKLNPGRQTLEFAGTAGAFRQAFGTEIHQYAAQGGTHFANSSAPQIPAALAPVFGGFASLNNFSPKSHAHVSGKATYDPSTHAVTPQWTIGSPSTGLNYVLAPADFAVQYDLNPAYAAGNNGAGQSIAIINISNIDVYLVNQFRSLFGLPASQVRVIIDGDDPGINSINDPYGQSGALTEAYLDVEEAGAVAPGATIDLVIASNTTLSSGLFLAAEHAVYSNVAPIMSLSFGDCEAQLGGTNQFLNGLWQQAAAQGITVVVSAGDGGSAGCDDFDIQEYAVNGQAVSGFAATPYNVSVGGTDFYYSAFNQGNAALQAQIGTYWNQTPTNSAPTLSLLSPAPEQVWNDSQYGLNILNEYVADKNTNIIAGSGGASTCGIPTISMTGAVTACSPYPKPTWQAGKGVPADGVRDQPDLALFAANGYNDSFYPICASAGDCQPVPAGGNIQITAAGGTSAAAPAFAGIMALVNQRYGPQGQANYTLYPLAAQFPAAFHDLTAGTNSVPCNINTTSSGQSADGCIPVSSPVTVADSTYGTATEGQIGSGTTPEYNAGAGYDLGTGLGSVDASVLLADWGKVSFAGTTTTLTPSSTSFVHGSAVTVTGSVTAAGAGAVPTGSVALMTTSTAIDSQQDGVLPLTAGTFSTHLNTLPGGTYSVYGRYSGDPLNGASSSTPVSVTVTPETSATALEVLNPGNNSVAGTSIPYGSAVVLESLTAPSASLQAYVGCIFIGGACPVFGTPTGAVTFTDGGTTLGTLPLTADGESAYTYSPSVGTHTVTGSYSGDSSYGSSSTAAASFTVVKATPYLRTSQTTSTTLDGGQLTILAATPYTPYSQSSTAAPTGTLTLTGSLPGMPTALTLGGAALDYFYGSAESAANYTLPPGVAPGFYNVIIKYSGDANYNAVSFSTTVTISSSTLLPSITTAMATGTAITAAQTVQLTATVTGKTGNPAPTGTIFLGTPTVNGNYGYRFTLVPGSGITSSITATLPANALIDPGTNPIVVSYGGDSRYQQSATTVTIASPFADFSLTALAPTLVQSGASASEPITVTSQTGFTGPVQLTCAASGGVTCSFASPIVTLTTGASVADTLNLTLNGVVKAGAYNVVVTAIDATGTIIHTLGLAVSVTAVPDFSLTPAAAAVTQSGTSATDALTLASINQFAGPVTLACTATGGLVCSLTPPTVTLASGGTASSTLSVNTSAARTIGIYNVTVTATDASGVRVHAAVVTVNVTSLVDSFAITPAGAITIATQGGTGSTGLTITPAGIFSGAVNLTCKVTASPAGASFPPGCTVTTPVSVATLTAASATLTVTTTAQVGGLGHRPFGWLPAGGGTALAALFGWMLPRRRRRWAGVLAIIAGMVVLGSLAGCGGKSTSTTTTTASGGTTLGQYTLTVTGTDAATGQLTASTNVSVTVN